MASTDKRILNLPLITSGNVVGNIVLPLDDPNDGITKKINLDLIKTYTLSGITLSGNYLPLSGGSVTGLSNFTNGLSANTFSATTLYGDGSNLTGINSENWYTTGFTYENNNFTISDNSGNTFNTTINEVTGLTVNGVLSANTFSSSTINVDTITATDYVGLGFPDDETIESVGDFVRIKDIVTSPSGGTRTFQGNIIVTSGFSANTITISNSYTPSSSGDTYGVLGEITWDDSYAYVKTNNGWGRINLDYGF